MGFFFRDLIPLPDSGTKKEAATTGSIIKQKPPVSATPITKGDYTII